MQDGAAQVLEDFEKKFHPLGDLTLKHDHWLTVGNPENLVYRLIEENYELRVLYEETLGCPLRDGLQAEKKIRQLVFSFEKNGDSPPVFRHPDVDMLRVVLDVPFGKDDAASALLELEELLKELRGRYPKGQSCLGTEQPDEDATENQDVTEDYWAYVFDDVEKLQKLVSASSKFPDAPKKNFLACFDIAAGRFVRRYLPWHRDAERDKACWSELQKVMRSNRDGRYYDYPKGSDWQDILQSLQYHVRSVLAGTRNPFEANVNRFHRYLEQAVRHRYALVHKMPWPLQDELELAKGYLDSPVHTPWLTNYILTTILDTRILQLRAAAQGTLWTSSQYVWLFCFLGLVLAIYLLFASGLAWLAWPTVAFSVWRSCREWLLFHVWRKYLLSGSLIESARKEIASGLYDPAEIARRLQQPELSLASVPSLVYSLLRLEHPTKTQA